MLYNPASGNTLTLTAQNRLIPADYVRSMIAPQTTIDIGHSANPLGSSRFRMESDLIYIGFRVPDAVFGQGTIVYQGLDGKTEYAGLNHVKRLIIHR